MPKTVVARTTSTIPVRAGRASATTISTTGARPSSSARPIAKAEDIQTILGRLATLWLARAIHKAGAGRPDRGGAAVRPHRAGRSWLSVSDPLPMQPGKIALGEQGHDPLGHDFRLLDRPRILAGISAGAHLG